ncbi:MAG TPA: site-specific integrase [Firmicutes bacterium]|nr:site-specific integrase [Bacillota bacterium]
MLYQQIDVVNLLRGQTLPPLNFCSLHYTCATILIQNGANTMAVKELLGHTNIPMIINPYMQLT